VKAAAWPRDDAEAERLLVVDPEARAIGDFAMRDLPGRLRRGDLLVVNDAATLPGSLHARAAGEPVEVRLLGRAEEGTWTAALLGRGDWRQRTEDRPAPPSLPPGSVLTFAVGPALPLTASVVQVSDVSPRLVRLRFDRDADALWSAIYRGGRPVQYSYVRAPLALWHVQTAYASRPWAAEPPSAGRPLTWRVLMQVRRRGIALAALTHAAGLSSTGDAALDAALPLPERFDIPAATVDAVERTRAAGGRVVAVGTSVVRALEGAAERGRLTAGEGETALRIDRAFRPRVVAGILTGLHQPGESHFDLLMAFVSEALLRDALAHAEWKGYLGHEFGDSCLVLGGSV
jgi:S-adenosylmethionine:tRNA ribosyltransferase-isomerase